MTNPDTPQPAIQTEDVGDSPKDICERLREYRAFVSPESRTLNLEAAAEIERLQEALSHSEARNCRLLSEYHEMKGDLFSANERADDVRQDALEEAERIAETAKLKFNFTGISRTNIDEFSDGLKREFQARLRTAQTNAARRIEQAASEGKLASAMSTEGYDGGYYAALCDVDLVLRDITPSDHRGVWPTKDKTP